MGEALEATGWGVTGALAMLDPTRKHLGAYSQLELGPGGSSGTRIHPQDITCNRQLEKPQPGCATQAKLQVNGLGAGWEELA